MSTARHRPYRVLLAVHRPYVFTDTVADDSTPVYRGLLYDVWVVVRNRLRAQGFEFVETFVKRPTYRRLYAAVQRGTADVLIAPFAPSSRVTDYVRFTRPVLVSPYLLIERPKRMRWLRSMMSLAVFEFLPALLLVLGIGVAWGYAMYAHSPHRTHHSFYHYLVLTGCALTGFLGNLTHYMLGHRLSTKESLSATLQWVGVLILTLFAALFISVFIRSYITARLVQMTHGYATEQKSSDYLAGKTYLGSPDLPVADIAARYRAKRMIPHTGGLERMLSDFARDRSRYDGVLVGHSLNVREKATRHGLDVRVLDVGVAERAFAVAKTRTGLYDAINTALVKMSTGDELYTVCQRYTSPEDRVVCLA